jgi:hypothetical protein
VQLDSIPHNGAVQVSEAPLRPAGYTVPLRGAHWPGATHALMDAAHQQLISECHRHAELICKHGELMQRYRELLDQGTFLTASVAQDVAFDVCETEKQIRSLERALIGEEARCGR